MREDISRWQKDQKEFFQENILEIVEEYARWRDREERRAEQAVEVCPQCDGEGHYADGVDEAACSQPCGRCGSNGWIANVRKVLTAIAEGYPTTVHDDRYIVVENPQAPGDGTDPNLLIDIHESIEDRNDLRRLDAKVYRSLNPGGEAKTIVNDRGIPFWRCRPVKGQGSWFALPEYPAYERDRFRE